MQVGIERRHRAYATQLALQPVAVPVATVSSVCVAHTPISYTCCLVFGSVSYVKTQGRLE